MTGVLRIIAVSGLLAAATAVAAAPALAQNKTGGQARKAAPKLPDSLSGTANVLEGDTVSVDGLNVRLYGIDAPDPGQTCTTKRSQTYDCFKISTEVLKGLVGRKTVSCQIKGSDSLGQQTGVCTVDGVDLSAAMVARGWAFAYRRLSPQYAAMEASAMTRQRGMWGGRVEYPWLWRSRQLVENPPQTGKGKPKGKR